MRNITSYTSGALDFTPIFFMGIVLFNLMFLSTIVFMSSFFCHLLYLAISLTVYLFRLINADDSLLFDEMMVLIIS